MDGALFEGHQLTTFKRLLKVGSKGIEGPLVRLLSIFFQIPFVDMESTTQLPEPPAAGPENMVRGLMSPVDFALHESKMG